MSPRRFQAVNRSVIKLDALALARGGRLFTADLAPRDALCAKILTSPHAHARIRAIDASAAEALPGVLAVLHADRVPRVMRTTAGQGAPEPSPYDFTTFDRKVRFVGDRVAAVAAVSEAVALEALRLIRVEYEVLEPVLDPRQAQAPGAPVVHDEPDARAAIPVAYEPGRNLAARVEARVGDPEAACALAEIVLEAEYETQYAQHTPIEPHVCLAEPLSDGRLRITSSTQVPFHVRRIVAKALGWPVGRIQVIKPRIGGGFGAKQEVLCEDVVAFLAIATGRPVLLELTREEEFLSRTRHPMIIRLKTAARRDGALAGIELGVLSNTGAYGSHALTVACNSGSKVLPLYRWPAIHFQAEAVYTNLPVGGAYRGYGATQAYFALESQMDELARALGTDPIEFRLRHAIQAGEGSPIFQALGEGTEGVEMRIGSSGLRLAVELGARAIDWKERRSKPGTGPRRRGVGMCCLMQGSSIPEVDMGAAFLKLNEDGSFNLAVGATDLGTGSDTILAQIAAEVLGVEPGQIIVRSSDTDTTPFDVGAYASSTTYLSGEAVRKAARQVAQQIQKVAAEILGVSARGLKLQHSQVVGAKGEAVPLERIAMRSLYEHDQHQIAASASHISHQSPPPFAAHFAEVEVDTETGLVQVVKYVTATDCGTAINPTLAEGQIEGAVLNGISYALCEEFLFDPALRLKNASFGQYRIFSTRDLPELVTILVPTYEKSGPFGAKSVSEIGINGPLPAIANAIADAVGVRLRRAPFTPERVLEALDRARKGSDL